MTYVVGAGESAAVLDWYSRCFGMTRFLVNAAESPAEGVVVGRAQDGLRLTVGEWMSQWMCSGMKGPVLKASKKCMVRG